MVDAACGAWTRRLIDHSRANSLLFFRDLKVGTLDLTKDADAVSRLIAGNALHVEDLIPKPKPGGNPNLLPEAPPEHPPGHTLRACDPRESQIRSTQTGEKWSDRLAAEGAFQPRRKRH